MSDLARFIGGALIIIGVAMMAIGLHGFGKESIVNLCDDYGSFKHKDTLYTCTKREGGDDE